MNLLGKIFVVAILVMSIFFMAIAAAVFATHTNWRDAARALETKLQAAQSDNNTLKSELEALQTRTTAESTAQKEALAALETERERLAQINATLQNEQATLTQQRREATAAVEASHKTLADKRAEIEGLRTNIHSAQQERDKSVRQTVAMLDQLHQAEADLARLKRFNTRLSAQVAKAGKLLEPFRLTLNSPVDRTPPPLDGVVLDADSKGLVEISLGSDDGLERNHVLQVYRGSRYLGSIKVTEVLPDRAVAKIQPDAKGAIQREDRVATRLN
jgi:cell division protein FtsL